MGGVRCGKCGWYVAAAETTGIPQNLAAVTLLQVVGLGTSRCEISVTKDLNSSQKRSGEFDFFSPTRGKLIMRKSQVSSKVSAISQPKSFTDLVTCSNSIPEKPDIVTFRFNFKFECLCGIDHKSNKTLL
ncbi:hypothetical protein OGAPHI_002872 [Ogataea philodendri]|uniref:Uncharacterized protein n=1 Tax=Ogataea philodendri TaxID=1378263 RepID=A0A9P8P7K6_9ASCO|nr:uncharacterized protein OGAPHI_002872 [Ogataea philodendri]KAH3667223.1 hypothetical protein OGAPHI_002872 [Ogataea philodendri]